MKTITLFQKCSSLKDNSFFSPVLNKRQRILLLVWIIFFLAQITAVKMVNAQNTAWLWAKSGGGDNWDFAQDVVTDNSGNVIVAGYFSSSSITFGNITLINNSQINTSDLFLVKYDANGNVLWAKNAGGIDNENAYGVTTDARGNIYVTGTFASPTLTLGNIQLTNSGNNDIFIVRYDSEGKVKWAKSAGGKSDDISYAIASDGTNIYIAGYFQSATISFGNITLNNSGKRDLFFVKYDGLGNAVWARNAVGSSDDLANGITCDPSGNLLVTGSYYSPTLSFGSTSLTLIGGSDLFLAKYNGSGTLLWAKSGGGNFTENGSGVTTDAVGNIYIGGSFNSKKITFDNISLSNSAEKGYDLFIVKYDAGGNALWVKGATGVGAFDDYGTDVITDASNNVYLTGTFSSNTLTFGQISLTCSGPYGIPDIFITKYDASGNVLSANSAQGTGAEYCYRVASDRSGNVFITGGFSSFNLTFGNTILQNAVQSGGYSYDAFVAKYGNQQFGNLSRLSGEDTAPSAQSTVNVYPNVNQGKFMLDFKTNNQSHCEAKVQVMNAAGQIVYNEGFPITNGELKKEISLNNSNASGIYLVRVLLNDQEYESRLVIQK